MKFYSSAVYLPRETRSAYQFMEREANGKGPGEGGPFPLRSALTPGALLGSTGIQSSVSSMRFPRIPLIPSPFSARHIGYFWPWKFRINSCLLPQYVWLRKEHYKLLCKIFRETCVIENRRALSGPDSNSTPVPNGTRYEIRRDLGSGQSVGQSGDFHEGVAAKLLGAFSDKTILLCLSSVSILSLFPEIQCQKEWSPKPQYQTAAKNPTKKRRVIHINECRVSPCDKFRLLSLGHGLKPLLTLFSYFVAITVSGCPC